MSYKSKKLSKRRYNENALKSIKIISFNHHKRIDVHKEVNVNAIIATYARFRKFNYSCNRIDGVFSLLHLIGF